MRRGAPLRPPRRRLRIPLLLNTMDYLFLLMVAFLAFGNDANDNFKGFATVWGARTLSYRHALALATIATVAGSIASLLLAEGLVKQFSGRGLVPEAIASAPWFIQSVAAGASVTILIATRAGLPVSTTHALKGLRGRDTAGGQPSSSRWRTSGTRHFSDLDLLRAWRERHAKTRRSFIGREPCWRAGLGTADCPGDGCRRPAVRAARRRNHEPALVPHGQCTGNGCESHYGSISPPGEPVLAPGIDDARRRRGNCRGCYECGDA